jgi:glyoxylase-like metal-dependent hydrolase (beta-lactamase superfamily II)/rhodanese-related sulfurtransferase
MEAYSFTAEQLYDEIFSESDRFILLDVRNNEEFEKFSVEGPYLHEMINVPYFEFLEFEEDSIKKVPAGEKIKIVCAKEGSAKYVAEILLNSGFKDVGYLAGGIGTWADLLKPVLIEKNDRFELYQFIRPGKASLSYGLVCGRECFIFDPARLIDVYLGFAAQKNAKITTVFETHLQADYISGSRKLAAENSAGIIAHKGDFGIAVFEYLAVEDGQVIELSAGTVAVKTIHTPGHTPGSTSYLVDNRFLITGDAVFIKSIGRPDLGGQVEEWSNLEFDTLRNVLKPMNGNIRILPGHYMDWSEMAADGKFMESLAVIMKNNRRIYDITDAQVFTDFIRANMRQQPEVYARIRQVNAGLLEPDGEEQKIMDIGKNECAASHA